MDKILIATIGGLGALLFWGISDWLTSKTSKKFSSVQANLAIQTTGALIMTVVWMISRLPFPAVAHLLILLLGALLFTGAYLCFIKGLAVGEAGVVVPLANIYPLFTLLLTFVFMTVSFTFLQVVAMITVVLGAVLLGTEKLNWRQVRKHLTKEVVYALGTAIFWGLGFFVINTVVEELSWVVVLGVVSIAMWVYALVFYAVKNKNELRGTIPSIIHNKFGLFAGATLTLGSVTFYISAEASGGVVVPAVIAAGSPLVTSLLAAVFDKEKLIITKRIGAVMVVLGVVLLNL